MRLKLLVVSEFFPHARHVHEGIYAREVLEHTPHAAPAHVFAPAVRYPAVGRYRALRERTAVPGLYRDGGTVVHRVPLPYCPRLAEIYLPDFFFARCKKLILQHRIAFDFVHAHWAFRSGYVAYRLAQYFRRPCVITVSGSDINDWLQERRKRAKILQALRAADAITTPNAQFRHRLIEEGLAENKISVIPHGVDLQKFFPQASPLRAAVTSRFPNAFVVLCIANLYPVKGVDFLLRALTDVPENIALIHLGDGPERRRLHRLARALKLEPRIWFAGQKPPQEVPLWLNAVDALVIPSRKEAKPVVALEALACGKPVIGTDVGILREAINSPEIGIVATGPEPQGLAAALRRAPETTWSAEKARARAGDYSWETFGEKIQSIYAAAKTRFKAAGAGRPESRG